MPRLDQYIRRQTIPSEGVNVPGNIGGAGQVGEAVQGMAKAGVAFGANLMELDITRRHADLITKKYEEAQAKAEAYNEAQNIKVGIENRRAMILEKAAQETDYRKIDAWWKNDIQSWRDEIEAIENPLVKKHVALFAEQHITAADYAIRKARTGLFVQEAQGSLENRLNEYEKKSYFAADPIEAARYREEAIKDIDGAVESNVLKANAAAKLKIGLDERRDKVALQGYLNSNDPKVLQTVIDNVRNKDFLPNLDPTIRVNAEIHARSKMREMAAQFETDQNRYQQEMRYKVYDMLANPAVSIEKKNAYIDSLTKPDRATGFRGLDPREAYSIKESLKHGQDEGKTNYTVWNNLFQRIKNGEDVSGEIGRYVKNGLSVTDAKNLSLMTWRDNQKVLTEEEKKVSKRVDDSMKQFANLVKATFTVAGDTESQNAANLIIYDVQQLAEEAKNKDDKAKFGNIEWLESYQKKMFDWARDNRQSGIIKKLTQRASDELGTTGAAEIKTQQRQRPAAGGGSSGKQKSEVPPVQGAQKAPDGKWYIEQNGAYYEVR